MCSGVSGELLFLSRSPYPSLPELSFFFLRGKGELINRFALSTQVQFVNQTNWQDSALYTNTRAGAQKTQPHLLVDGRSAGHATYHAQLHSK